MRVQRDSTSAPARISITPTTYMNMCADTGTTSVANGLAATARVITAAAAIMVVVFGSFILENDRTFKLMGTGLATAILLDATIVRLLLVPATMELLGDKNWWLPKWLDRILPNIDVEGHYDDEDDAGPAAGTGSAGPEQQAIPVGD